MDIYTKRAAELFEVSEDQVTDAQRQEAKRRTYAEAFSVPVATQITVEYWDAPRSYFPTSASIDVICTAKGPRRYMSIIIAPNTKKEPKIGRRRYVRRNQRYRPM